MPSLLRSTSVILVGAVLGWSRALGTAHELDSGGQALDAKSALRDLLKSSLALPLAPRFALADIEKEAIGPQAFSVAYRQMAVGEFPIRKSANLLSDRDDSYQI